MRESKGGKGRVTGVGWGGASRVKRGGASTGNKGRGAKPHARMEPEGGEEVDLATGHESRRLTFRLLPPVGLTQFPPR